MRILLLTAALLTLSAAPALAQDDAPRHQGFWIGFGLGGGSNLDAPDSRGGGAAYLRLGGTINQQLLIGADIGGWAREVNDATVSRGNAAATVYFYPVIGRGLFLKSGLGFASAQVQGSTTVGGRTTTVTIGESGFGATFGAGYDIRLGSNFYLVPNLDFLVQVINDETDSLLLLTIGVGWH